MREIEFRGKKSDDGEWVYGHYVRSDLGPEGIEYIIQTAGDYYNVDPETVGQYAGLKDKNGKKIYEGDVVKQEYVAQTGNPYNGTDESFEGHHIGEVVISASKGTCMKKPFRYSLENDETTISNQYKNLASYRCEIIGNIVDNPELLEGAK